MYRIYIFYMDGFYAACREGMFFVWARIPTKQDLQAPHTTRHRLQECGAFKARLVSFYTT